MNERRKPYPFDRIEPKWQASWDEESLISCAESRAKRISIRRNRSIYVLDMFPYPSGAGLARRTSRGLHGDGHHRALQTPVRFQRSPPDGLGRIRPPGRAICDQDRTASRHHHARECGEVQGATETHRLFLRLGTRSQHDRSRLLQMDAVDFPPDLQLLVQPGDEKGGTAFPPIAAPIPTAFASLTWRKSR